MLLGHGVENCNPNGSSLSKLWDIILIEIPRFQAYYNLCYVLEVI